MSTQVTANPRETTPTQNASTPMSEAPARIPAYVSKPAPPQKTRSPLTVVASGLTDRGQTRQSNQDQFLVATFTGTLWVEQSSFPQERVQVGSPQGHLFAVADGMGGHAGGEQASQLAMGAIETFLLGALGWLDRMSGQDTSVLDELRAALRRADATVAAAGKADPSLHHMGTTLTLAYSVDDTLYIAHAGDSRAYIFRDGSLYQITRDHTVTAELVAAGLLTKEAATTHGLRHLVTNVIGGGQAGVAAEVHKVDLVAGDTLVLCSDGLTGAVNDEGILHVLKSVADPRDACTKLIAMANEAGGPDNITVTIARYS